MNIEQQEASKFFTILGAQNLDPITVIMQDIAPGKGRLIVECYGEAWTGYWGAMGERSVQDFVVGNDADYLANRMRTPRMIKRDVTYLKRIMVEVLNALYEMEGC